MAASYIKVTGLAELRKALAAAELIEPAELRAMMRSIAEVIVLKARPRMESQIHDPRSTGALEDSIRASSTVRSASINEGTPVRTAYAGWWEFGGPLNASKKPPNREYIKEGRVLYPTLVEERDEIQAMTEGLIEHLAQLIIETG